MDAFDWSMLLMVALLLIVLVAVGLMMAWPAKATEEPAAGIGTQGG